MTRGLLFSLLASAVAFFLLSFLPGARQNEIFPYDELCDYRMFVLPCMTSERPYSAPATERRDACYPPIAYCAIRSLSSDRGEKWRLSEGEIRLLLSLLLAQCLGVMLLARKIPRQSIRIAAAASVLLSPACICTLLRGNPSGWSFALVCVFLFGYRSDDAAKRLLAAVSLGAATSLKVAPCLFGCLYLAESVSRRRFVFGREIAVSAFSAVVLTYLPFLFFGGVSEIPQWISNASANAAFYSADNPMWGIAAMANHIIDSKEMVLPSISRFVWVTRIFAAILVAVSIFAQRHYRRLLYLGGAMAFLTHHDYGGAYLVPAFVVWIHDFDEVQGVHLGVCPLLESVAWFLVFTPLQIPNPLFAGSLNVMLQNEALFLLLILSLFSFRVKRSSYVMTA